jgi:hypothetical protein
MAISGIEHTGTELDDLGSPSSPMVPFEGDIVSNSPCVRFEEEELVVSEADDGVVGNLLSSKESLDVQETVRGSENDHVACTKTCLLCGIERGKTPTTTTQSLILNLGIDTAENIDCCNSDTPELMRKTLEDILDSFAATIAEKLRCVRGQKPKSDDEAISGAKYISTRHAISHHDRPAVIDQNLSSSRGKSAMRFAV